jgi:hypothetical protein
MSFLQVNRDVVMIQSNFMRHAPVRFEKYPTCDLVLSTGPRRHGCGWKRFSLATDVDE